ncbi:hypothetical protein DH2020_021530 [Rehmannia glutinosa]|uniref:Leucine-rich repeat-containing N-terminal plant-type domain-containing protein n=1 Tax=Rehmannia glutinosa TaxID=99300 RepID=A0ABR0WC65_REHGL
MAISGSIFILFTLVFIHGLTICSSHTNSSSRVKCIDRERIALSKFQKSLTDESGRLLSWIGQECCSWKGITCSNKTGHVLKLNLHNPTPFDNDRFYNSQDGEYIDYYSKSCLAGELNPALLDLKQLQFLDLSMNNFSGSEIPKFFGSFKNLKHLNLSAARFQQDLSNFWTNRLTSESLHWVSSLSYLKHLDLSGVSLRQAKNWLDSVNGLQFLTKLNLSNTLVATIPPLTRCPNFTTLVSLDLQWNIITSDIPHWLFDLSNLIELRLDGNGIRGPIPEAFGKLTNLTVLGLSRNYFNTSVPDSLFNLRNLTYLDLSQNKLQGTIPNAIVNLCNLKFLDLTDNRFTGKIPDFGINQNDCLQDIDVLRISYNSLNGPISASFGTLSSLRELDISNNILNGSIPSSFGQLSNLEKLELSNNSLSGMVTELHFSKMSKLTEMSLSLNNLLVFNVSSDWIPPFQLKTIKLSSCTLGPLFPSWLKTQENVVELRISRAGISDRLPDWFEKVYSRVHYLDMSKNNISGQLPQFEEANNRPFRRLILNSNSFDGQLRPLPSDVLLWDVSNNFVSGNIPVQNGTNLTLEVLILSSNLLSGLFPGFLCEIKTMTILDLANNRFTGKLPECIGEIENLSMLDLTNNTLHGEIPNSLGNLPLLSLHLHNNNFQGQLPSLENAMFLNILDVGKNSFTSVIPPWIGENLQYLAFLSLQSNNFHGEIPEKLCQVPQLQLLNLARNNLTGNIPPCIGNFSAMIMDHSSIEYLMLDVDYGGSIPGIINGIERRYTKTMPFLTSIDFSDNNIVGEIPDNLTGLVGLRNLNLAGNNLTGKIPGKIGDMQELISLDLSRNELSGQIPPSLSDLNFLTYLNLSYNNLSGRIPTGNQLRTLDPSVYLGNDGLCGAPLVRRCDGDAPAPQDNDRTDINEGDDDDDDDSLFPWFYAGIGPGFLFGFLVVCGILHFVRSWRYVFFKWVEYVAVGSCCFRPR